MLTASRPNIGASTGGSSRRPFRAPDIGDSTLNIAPLCFGRAPCQHGAPTPSVLGSYCCAGPYPDGIGPFGGGAGLSGGRRKEMGIRTLPHHLTGRRRSPRLRGPASAAASHWIGIIHMVCGRNAAITNMVELMSLLLSGFRPAVTTSFASSAFCPQSFLHCGRRAGRTLRPTGPEA